MNMSGVSGNPQLAIFFGSQTGNAEELAEKTAKMSKGMGFAPVVLDMDGFNPAQFADYKRVLIITSTWGEGDMPDNAEDLWMATNETNPPLAGVSFSVCAIGDTSYDEFCKAGIDWDQKFAQLGATRVHDIQLCDVDYEPVWKSWADSVLPVMQTVDGGEYDESTAAPSDAVVDDTSSTTQVNSEGASEALNAVFAGDRSINILFGSQTGNAAGLAEKTAKLAANFGLQPTVVDMDGFDPAKLATMKRVMIITSTWGEGEMPDNADAMWNAINANGPALASVHYSVCAIGDTSYDEFCKAGHDWNDKLAALGGKQAHPIQECDVDFEPPWKVWVEEALPLLACVDDSGTLQVELLDEMKAYGTGDEETAVDGDFAPATVVADEMSITLRLFRYDPVAASSGFDTVSCALPGHASLQDLLEAVQGDLDGSLAFRRGDGCGTPTTAIRANGRIVLADVARLDGLVNEGGTLLLEPLPGLPVVRDLIVDTSRLERKRSEAKPWMRADPRSGERLSNGSTMGTMNSAEATSLHSRFDAVSDLAAHGMSDTTPFDDTYVGPGVLTRLWQRASDPRCGEEQRRELMKTLQQDGGMWSETDLSSISRQGEDGRLISEAMLDARGRLLHEFRFAGRAGRQVKWYGRSVKWSGKLNETTLYRQVLGPLGLVSNVFSGVSARMVFGFTRTGGPPIRSLQALLLPPAGVGKIPNMFNSKVVDHHEVVSLFNELDQRF
ncbi:MAG: hypothetical protein CMB11_07510 [Euryarchaeota archaeon]|nr:hypothetical protein [Euryarchaeota archaeon]